MINKTIIKEFMKVVVFDVDGTLLHRSMEKVPNAPFDTKSNGRFIYFRPHLEHLAQNLPSLEQRCRVVLWTSMRRKNAVKIQQLLLKKNLRFDSLYSQQDCNEDLSKDLRIIANDYSVKVGDVILIDDSLEKRIENQNFMKIETYSGVEKNDQQIIRVLEELDKLLPKQPIQLPAKTIKKEQQEKIASDKPRKNKQTQKLPQVEETGKTEETTAQMSINESLKVVVFDLNKTLMMKRKEREIGLQNLEVPSKVKGDYVYLRPNLNVIKYFANLHAEHELKFLIWTTMQGTKTTESYLKVLKEAGLPFQGILNARHSTQGREKDLREVSQAYGVKLQNTILIDDSAYKCIQGQNFIKIESFTGDEKDTELIRIMEDLDKFISCTKEQCLIKQLIKNKVSMEELESNPVANPKSDKMEQPKKQANHKKPGFKAKTKKLQNPNSLEKEENVKEQQMIEEFKVRNFVKEGGKILCLVFDINQTLLVRSQKKYAHRKPDANFKRYFNYLRPNLEALRDFLQEHKVITCLWTTIMKQNSMNFVELLEVHGLKFDHLLTQEDLCSGRKDLRIISQRLEVPLQSIVLIDDNLRKRVDAQNFIQVFPFQPQLQKNDDVLIFLVKELEKIMAQSNKYSI